MVPTKERRPSCPPTLDMKAQHESSPASASILSTVFLVEFILRAGDGALDGMWRDGRSILGGYVTHVEREAAILTGDQDSRYPCGMWFFITNIVVLIITQATIRTSLSSRKLCGTPSPNGSLIKHCYGNPSLRRASIHGLSFGYSSEKRRVQQRRIQFERSVTCFF